VKAADNVYIVVKMYSIHTYGIYTLHTHSISASKPTARLKVKSHGENTLDLGGGGRMSLDGATVGRMHHA
jgi:hypothetical protein